jgi:hypothetical protein
MTDIMSAIASVLEPTNIANIAVEEASQYLGWLASSTDAAHDLEVAAGDIRRAGNTLLDIASKLRTIRSQIRSRGIVYE